MTYSTFSNASSIHDFGVIVIYGHLTGMSKKIVKPRKAIKWSLDRDVDPTPKQKNMYVHTLLKTLSSQKTYPK